MKGTEVRVSIHEPHYSRHLPTEPDYQDVQFHLLCRQMSDQDLYFQDAQWEQVDQWVVLGLVARQIEMNFGDDALMGVSPLVSGIHSCQIDRLLAVRTLVVSVRGIPVQLAHSSQEEASLHQGHV